MIDVIGTILQEMLDDDANDSEHLIRLYEDADVANKAVIDSVLTCICGWGMPTLIEKAKGK